MVLRVGSVLVINRRLDRARSRDEYIYPACMKGEQVVMVVMVVMVVTFACFALNLGLLRSIGLSVKCE